jgi:hypothetical protein
MSNRYSNIGFRQFPTPLKLVMLYMGLLCLGQLVTFLFKLFNDSTFAWYDLISGIAYYSLALGLLTKRPTFRILTMLWAFIEILNRAFVLSLAVFSRQVRFEPFAIRMFALQIPLLELEWVILWSLLLALNISIFVIFLRPDVKAIFSKRNLI